MLPRRPTSIIGLVTGDSRPARFPASMSLRNLATALFLAVSCSGGCGGTGEPRSTPSPEAIPGKVQRTADGEIEKIVVRDQRVSSSELSAIGQVTGLKGLALFDCQLPVGGLNKLLELKQLKQLDLSRSSVTDADLADVGRLTSLEVVDL